MIRSLRWRLQLWHSLVLVVVLAGFGGIVHYLQWQTRLQQVDEELDRAAEVVQSRLRRLIPFPSRRSGRSGPRLGVTNTRPTLAQGQTAPAASAERPRPPAAGERSTDGPRRDGEPDQRRPDRDESRGRRERGGRPWEQVPLKLPEELVQMFAGPDDAQLYFAIWNREGKLLQKSSEGLELTYPGLKSADDQLPVRVSRMRGPYREVIHVTHFDLNILVGRSIDPEYAAQHQATLVLFGSGAGVLAVGLLGGLWFTSYSIRPIYLMADTARSISANNLSQRINLTKTDNELGELANVLNHAFDRLQEAFDQQQRFTADASHELRTPLAVLLAQTELALSRPRTAAEYYDALATCQRVARRMRALIEHLLLLARFDAGAQELPHTEVDFAALVQTATSLVQPLADLRQVTIHCDLPAYAPVQGNAERLSQAVTNLLTNAIRYNREGGQIRVALRTEDDAFELTISDTGCGIAAEDLTHIFDRFYRVDPARSRADGGSGLGLSICETIVRTHQGRIFAESVLGEGTTFHIWLPRLPLIQASEPRRLEAATTPPAAPALSESR